MNIYEISKEMKTWEELYLECIDEETGEIREVNTLNELQISITDSLVRKGTGIIKYIKNTESNMSGIDEEIKRLQALKKSSKTKIENFKDFVRYSMENMEVKKIETELGNLVLRKSKSVNIDENLIDMEDERFIKTEIKKSVSKTELKKLIESGEEIKGAALIEKNSLNIK